MRQLLSGKTGALLGCALLAVLAGVALVAGQDTLDGSMGATSATSATSAAAATNLGGRFRQMFQFDPVVDTGVSPLGGRRVNVHVPGFFDLKLDTRANNGGLRMSQSILSGLVSVFMDRTRNTATGQLEGPLSVKVAGMSMYQNEAARTMDSSSVPSLGGGL